MDEVTLDWSTAEVKNAKLTVPLEGDIPKGWRRSFETTVKLLGGGDVGRDSGQEGARSRSATSSRAARTSSATIWRPSSQQANADHEPDDGEEDEAPDEDESEPGAGDEDEGPDAEMTRRFRSS